jgi:pimeloyl-ACP methyl ester carboxylesterase
VAAGYQKLVLYGTSYGTKVALEYAERYPQNVESLVLDSVVPSNEEEPFQAPTFQAIGPVMNELCSHGGCAGITPDPIREIARLDARISRRSLKGAIYDGSGKRHAASLEPLELFNLLVAGDQNPILRTMLPGAVAAALKGDPSPLLRLQSLAEGVVPTLASESGREAGSEGGENGILYTDTTCEEEPLPWSRTAPAATRLEEARAAVRRLPPNTFYPFAPTTAYVSSDVALCASWPSAAPAPPPPSPLPNVPTLIFSGEQDLRTPTSGALSVAARIPDAQVLRVPFTGHSVIGSDLSSCSSKAIASFFGGSTVKPCAVLRRLPVTEVPPEGLAGVRPLRVLQGRPGRTVVATLDTLQDLVFTEDGAILENGFLPVGSSFGGLHGGYAKLVRRAVVLSNYSYVPGVFVSGTLRAHRKGSRASLTLSISGPQGADGTITLTPNRASGILGGRRFNVSDVGSRVASLSGGELPSEAQIQALADRTAPSRAETPRLPRSR